MKKILKLLGFYTFKATKYNGRNYLQGIGFDVEAEYLHTPFGNILLDFTITGEGEWLRKLKLRMAEDEKQQSITRH